MKLKKITPVIVVDAIEPCLEFWVDRLGFTKTVEVPHEGALGFVILNHSPTEIMLQSRASVEADVPARSSTAPRKTASASSSRSRARWTRGSPSSGEWPSPSSAAPRSTAPTRSASTRPTGRS